MSGGQGFSSQQGTLGGVVTVALVGITVGLSQGALEPTPKQVALVGQVVGVEQSWLTGPPHGQAVASALGNVTPSRTQSISGQALDVGQGAVSDGGTPDRTQALGGQEVAALAGDVTALDFGDTYVTVAQGDVDNAISITLGGQIVATSTGALGNIGAPVTLDLIGVQAGADAGTVGIQRRKPLSGESVQVQSGALGAEAVNNITLALTGQTVSVTPGHVLVISNLSRMGRWRGGKRLDSMPRTGVRNTKRTWR